MNDSASPQGRDGVRGEPCVCQPPRQLVNVQAWQDNLGRRDIEYAECAACGKPIDLTPYRHPDDGRIQFMFDDEWP